jgi:hypothetical protein
MNTRVTAVELITQSQCLLKLCPSSVLAKKLKMIGILYEIEGYARPDCESTIPYFGKTQVARTWLLRQVVAERLLASYGGFDRA